MEKFKISTPEGLLKGFSGLVGHFKKAAAHHDALHKAHTAIATTHSEHAAFHKGKADAMDDGDPGKSACSKTSDFHTAKAAFHSGLASLHKAHAAHNQEMADAYDVSDKTILAPAQKCAHDIELDKACTDCKREDKPAVAETPINLDGFVATQFKSAMDSLGKSDAFKKMFEEAISAKVSEMLGKTVVPTNVRGVLPNAPEKKDNVRPIIRIGGAPLEEVDTTGVDPEMEEFVKTEESQMLSK